MFVGLAFAIATGLSPAGLSTANPISDLTQIDYILPAQRTVTYGPAGEIRRVTNSVLSSEAQTAYDTEFATATYYGAFATSKDGGWGYSVGSNSLGAAREIALQECLGQNAQCVIVAELIPVGYVEMGPGDVTIAPEVTGHFQDASTNVFAFATAVSADGAYSKVWGMATQAEADAAALSDCEGYRINDLPNLSDMPCVLLPRPTK